MGGVEHRATLPVLSHVLLRVDNQDLTITATDTEIQVTSYITLEKPTQSGIETLPAKMLMDICRSLSEDAELTLTVEGGKGMITSGRGRYTLSTLPADDFPSHDDEKPVVEFTLEPAIFTQLIEKTGFSMGQGDVRHYLNGMLWHLSGQQLTVVSSDGHRMSLDRCQLPQELSDCQIIVPRKGISELARILTDCEETLLIKVGKNSLSVSCSVFEFISKQVDAVYPQYSKFIPLNNNSFFITSTAELKQLLSRIAIFTHDKQRTVRFNISENLLLVKSSDLENDIGEEDIGIEYQGESLSLGFNVSYLLECLGAISSERVKFLFSSSGSGVVLEPEGGESQALYVIMPICL